MDKKIRDPNSIEAQLIADWRKLCKPEEKDAPIPQLYIYGWMDAHTRFNP